MSNEGALNADNKPNVEVRLGAIYALERIAFDSPRDQWTIMEVLTAYVRQNAPVPAREPTKQEQEKDAQDTTKENKEPESKDRKETSHRDSGYFDSAWTAQTGRQA